MRWLAFGILSGNRFRIWICASLTALSGAIYLGFTIVWVYAFYSDPEIFSISNTVKYGVKSLLQFVLSSGFLWLLFSKKT